MYHVIVVVTGPHGNVAAETIRKALTDDEATAIVRSQAWGKHALVNCRTIADAISRRWIA
ncbi:MAG TPA: hypothetical protein VEA16_10945 [Vicinamibacterales bacterium]|nr:hypothetical protein [Vicinamibacterales bacterium]